MAEELTKLQKRKLFLKKRRNPDWYRKRDFKIARIEEARKFYRLRYRCPNCGHVSHEQDETHVCLDGSNRPAVVQETVAIGSNPNP
jgi:N-acetylglutamate synthase-like GNAT family acetyltransferase